MTSNYDSLMIDKHATTPMTMTRKPFPTLPVGFVVEGESEIGAIPQLLRDCRIPLSKPIKFGGQPVECNIHTFREFVKRQIVPRVRASALKKVRSVIVVIDRESREDCPGEFAQDIAHTIVDTMKSRYSYTGSPPVSVVCVDRTLENWLLADPKGICTHNYIDKDLSRAVGSKADGKDAVTMLKEAYTPGRYYHKRMDAPNLARRVRTVQRDVRLRSPSLDKLLREFGVAAL